MTESDLNAIVDLESQLQTHPWRRSHFENCLAIGNLALLVESPKHPIVAFAIVSIGGGESELLNIGVDPQCQGQGIAKSFLGEIISQVTSQADAMFLEVRLSNNGAIALYESLGFNQVGVRANYYNTATGREDALIYAIELL